MTDFATQTEVLEGLLASNDTISWEFGPVSAGPLLVLVTASIPSRAELRPLLQSRPRTEPTQQQRETRRTLTSISRLMGGSFDDITAPGYDDPIFDVPPPQTLDDDRFRIGIFNSQQDRLGQGDGTTVFEIEENQVEAGQRWSLSVYNGTFSEAYLRVHVRYQSQVALQEMPFDIQALNETLETVNDLGPLPITFEIRPRLSGFPVLETWLVLEDSPATNWVNVFLRQTEWNLERKVFDTPDSITAHTEPLSACVIDGFPAIRIAVRFPRDKKVVDIIDVLSLPSGANAFADLYYAFTTNDRPTAELLAVYIETFLVLRPIADAGNPTIEVFTHSYVENAGSKKYGLLVESLARGVIERVERELDDFVPVFSNLVYRTQELRQYRGDEALTLKYLED